MNFMEEYNCLYFFFIVQFVLFIFQNICFTKIENFQYVEMLSGSLLIVLIFGYFGKFLLKTDDNLFTKSVLLASFFAIWYYFTKYFTNELLKDSNKVIHWNTRINLL